MVHLLQMVLHASQLLVTSCYPRFSSSLRLSGQLKHLTFTKLYYTRLYNNMRLSGQLKHLIFTEALLYQASQQYETEWTAETPNIHEGFTIPGFTTIRDWVDSWNTWKSWRIGFLRVDNSYNYYRQTLHLKFEGQCNLQMGVNLLPLSLGKMWMKLSLFATCNYVDIALWLETIDKVHRTCITILFMETGLVTLHLTHSWINL